MILFIVLPFVLLSDARPVALDIEYGEKFEGDIEITPEKISALYGTGYASRRGILLVGRWINGVVYYRFHPGVKTANRERIVNAMDAISAVSCVQFVYRTTQIAYITISAGNNKRVSTCHLIV